MSGKIFPEFDQYISPAGDVFNFDGMFKFNYSIDGLGFPDIDYISQQGPFQHGVSIIDYRLKSRIIQMQFSEYANTRWDYWEKRAQFIDMFRPNRHSLHSFGPGSLRKNFPDGSAREIKVHLDQGPKFILRNLDTWQETSLLDSIRFIAPDPTFFDPELHSVLLNTEFTDHLLFPFSFQEPDMLFGAGWGVGLKSIFYEGTWGTFPTVVLGGPYDNVKVMNLSTGEQITLTRSIYEGETITMDLSYGNKTVTNENGENFIGLVTSDSDLATFHIAPDPEVDCGLNRIKVFGAVVGLGNSFARLDYYDRYIGI